MTEWEFFICILIAAGINAVIATAVCIFICYKFYK